MILIPPFRKDFQFLELVKDYFLIQIYITKGTFLFIILHQYIPINQNIQDCRKIILMCFNKDYEINLIPENQNFVSKFITKRLSKRFEQINSKRNSIKKGDSSSKITDLKDNENLYSLNTKKLNFRNHSRRLNTQLEPYWNKIAQYNNNLIKIESELDYEFMKTKASIYRGLLDEQIKQKHEVNKNCELNINYDKRKDKCSYTYKINNRNNGELKGDNIHLINLVFSNEVFLIVEFRSK